jgi:predicted nucleic acid-binding Zn ribbon protein
VADHASPETFTDGKLVVRADSTAWATQLNLLVPQLQRRMDEEVGEGVIAEIVVLGPGAPSWIRGPRVAPGRGPRDTYG